jgi:limonene-1,2-epoxide hydrolase
MNVDGLRETIVRAYEELGVDQEAGIDLLASVYHERVRFRDPLTTIEGRDALVAAMRRHHGKMRALRTEVRASASAGSDVFLAWRFSVTLRVGPALTFDGASHFRVLEGHVVEHRDYFDLLGSLMNAAPFVAPVYRRVVALFA